MPASSYLSIYNRNLNLALDALRDRAEKQQALLAEIISDGKSPEEVERLKQVQLHQIELEMQYKELLVAQAESEAQRVRYTDLFHFAPIGYVTLDVLGMIQELNVCAGELLRQKHPHLMGKSFEQFVAPADLGRFRQFLIDVLAAGQTLTCELNLYRNDQVPFPVRLQGMGIPDAYGTRQCRLVIIEEAPCPPE